MVDDESHSSEPAEAERAEEAPAEPPPPPPAERRRVYAGTGVYTAVVAGIVIATAIVLFIAQNTEGVHIEWIIWEADIALAAIVLASMLLGIVLSEVVGWIWRRRQRRVRTEREELERLRAAQR